MSHIKSRDTKPELRVRSLLHRMGYRFRIHRKDLPGNPDIVLPMYKKIIFVHGCFWHRHEGCKMAYTVKTNAEKWNEKFQKNVERDKKVKKKLVEMDWKVHTIWECETKSDEKLKQVLINIFEDT